MKNDQWFEPGDKVMRVCDVEDSGFPEGLAKSPPYGEVLCVVDFCEQDDGNLCLFAGYPMTIYDGKEWWETAACYRKVEEIRLCVKAAQAIKEIKPEEVSA